MLLKKILSCVYFYIKKCMFSKPLYRVTLTTCRMKKITVTYFLKFFYWAAKVQTIKNIQLKTSLMLEKNPQNLIIVHP